MVLLSLLFLAVMTLALPHTFVTLPGEVAASEMTPGMVARASALERIDRISHWAVGVLVVLAIPFWLEAIARLLVLERGPAGTCLVPRPTTRRKLQLLAGCLVPPIRTGLSPATLPGRMWLPLFGWRKTTRVLARHVQRAFGMPMLVVGLLILPVLIAEFAFADVLARNAGLATGVDVATRVIWLAFALEFTVMLAVTPRKLEYAIRHWVDLVIILLPFLAFLRSLQVVRVGQLIRAQRISQLAATYRLRGLAVKLLQAILVLRVLESISDALARRRIMKVHEQMHRRAEEIEEMQQEMVELRAELAKRIRRKRAKRRLKRSQKRLKQRRKQLRSDFREKQKRDTLSQSVET